MTHLAPTPIHPALVLQEQIRAAVDTLRSLAWDNGITGNTSHAAEDAEENASHNQCGLRLHVRLVAAGITEHVLCTVLDARAYDALLVERFGPAKSLERERRRMPP